MLGRRGNVMIMNNSHRDGKVFSQPQGADEVCIRVAT